MSDDKEIVAIRRRLDRLEGKDLKDAYEEFKKKFPKVFGPGDVKCGPNPDPDNTHIKPGGWGGDMASANTWEAVQMRDEPNLWKIVDQAGKNIAHKLASKNEAEKYIEYHECIQEGGDIPAPEPEPEPEPTPGGGEPPKPTEGNIKPGGWGANQDAKKWAVTNMKDPTTEYKIIDQSQINVADHFTTHESAERYIKWHEWKQRQQPVPTPTPTPTPAPTTGSTPYPIKGTPMQSSQRGPTERHYRSGKPDDWTIEKNVKSIPFENYQWVTYTTMGPIEHDDNISVKFGGVHMGEGGWWDCGISFQGKTCLGTEPEHPETHLCIVKGPVLGSVLNKKVGVAGVVFKKQGKIELWIDMGDGWKKAVEGTNVGNLKPTQGNQEAQLRIDGFDYKGKKDESDIEKLVAAGGPRIHSAIVTGI